MPFFSGVTFVWKNKSSMSEELKISVKDFNRIQCVPWHNSGLSELFDVPCQEIGQADKKSVLLPCRGCYRDPKDPKISALTNFLVVRFPVAHEATERG